MLNESGSRVLQGPYFVATVEPRTKMYTLIDEDRINQEDERQVSEDMLVFAD